MTNKDILWSNKVLSRMEVVRKESVSSETVLDPIGFAFLFFLNFHFYITGKFIK